MEAINEHIHFRLIQTPCCGHLLCWLNPRLPTYCSECGKSIFTDLRVQAEKILISDLNAQLRYHR